MQSLWQAHYQVFLRKFIELNVNLETTTKIVKHVKLNISIATSFLEYTNFKGNIIEQKCLCHQRKFGKNLKQQFCDTYKFSNHHNKFILLLWKGVYPYEYMDDLEKLYETSLPKKEDFYSHLNMEYNTNADYTLAKGVVKDFEI